MSIFKLLHIALFLTFMYVSADQSHVPWFKQTHGRHGILGQVHERNKEHIGRFHSYHQIMTASYPPRRSRLISLKFQALKRSAGLTVNCGETKVRIVVKTDYFGRGLPFHPTSLRLGNNPKTPGTCTPVSENSESSEMVITTGLHECDGESRVSDDWLIYSNELVFSPPPTLIHKGNLMIRGARITVPIECHYKRKHGVSGGPVHPTWKSFTSSVKGAGLLHFSLDLMKGDWSGPRSSTVFQQGEPVNLEAAVDGLWNPPLRIYVDRCVATLNSDPHSEPIYNIITNHGCLADSAVPSSSSQFFPRSRQNVLRFSVHGLHFLGHPQQQIFVNCQLRATLHQSPTDPLNKACFFHHPSLSWHAVEGDGAVCKCCEMESCSSWMPARATAHSLPRIPLGSEGQTDSGVGPLQVRSYSEQRASLTVGDELIPYKPQGPVLDQSLGVNRKKK